MTTWFLAYNTTDEPLRIDTDGRFIDGSGWTYAADDDPVTTELTSNGWVLNVPITFDPNDAPVGVDLAAFVAAGVVTFRNGGTWTPPPGPPPPGAMIVPLAGGDFDYSQVSYLGQLVNVGERGNAAVYLGDGVHSWDEGGGGELATSAQLEPVSNAVELLTAAGSIQQQNILNFNSSVLISRSGAYLGAGGGAAAAVGFLYGVEATILLLPTAPATNAHPELLQFGGAEVFNDYGGTGPALIAGNRQFVSITDAPTVTVPAGMPDDAIVKVRADLAPVAAQPTVDGKLMYLAGLWVDDDSIQHLFVGYGDYDTNTGPLDVISIDLSTGDMETQLAAWHTEAYNHIKVDPFNKWWIPSIDPRGSENATFATNAPSGTPQVVTVTPPAGMGPLVHCFDVTFIVNYVDGSPDGTTTVLACGARDMLVTDRHYVADGGMACVWQIDYDALLADDSTPWTEVMQSTIADDGMTTEDGFSRFYWFGDLDDLAGNHWIWMAHPSGGIFSGVCRKPDGTWHTLGAKTNFAAGVTELIPTFLDTGTASGMALPNPCPDGVAVCDRDGYGAPFFFIHGRDSGSTTNGYKYAWLGDTSPVPGVLNLRQSAGGFFNGEPLTFDPAATSLLAYSNPLSVLVSRWQFDGEVSDAGQLVLLATNGAANPSGVVWNRLKLPDVDETPAGPLHQLRPAPVTCFVDPTGVGLYLCDGTTIWGLPLAGG